jgi:DTW domain-containing protein YfiP
MSRQYCEQCAYPKKTCVCAVVETLTLPIRVVILQHDKESKHAKNSARLAKLVSPDIEIVKLSDTCSLKILISSIVMTRSLVLYPNDTSIALESYTKTHINTVRKSKVVTERVTLILIDASWRQAYGIWQQQAWLKELTHCHFANIPNKQYVIRKSKKQHQLSTIEALAHSVEIICGISGQAYLNIFNYMQEYWAIHQKE